MASSAKSEKLGLSLWEPEDAPRREDFRQDNEKLEELVGGHLENAALHLTATEKSYLKRPAYMTYYTGNGSSSRNFTVYSGFKNPNLVAVYAYQKPPAIIKDGVIWNYVALGSAKTPYSGSGGLKLGDMWVAVTQNTEEEGIANGYRICLNEKGTIYVIVMVQ